MYHKSVFHCNKLLLNFLKTLVVSVSPPTNPALCPKNYPSIKTHACDSVTEIPPVWDSCCSGKKWKVKCCLSSPISLHTSLWCCTNQSWPAVYHIRWLNASRGGPCKCVLRIKPCVWRRTVCNHLLPQWQEMERSVSRSNQRNMLMMSVRDCGDPILCQGFLVGRQSIFAWCAGRSKPVSTVWSERCWRVSIISR